MAPYSSTREGLAIRQDATRQIAVKQRQHAARQRVVEEYAEAHYAILSPTVSVQTQNPVHSTQYWTESMSTFETPPDMRLARVFTLPNEHWGSTPPRPHGQVNEDTHEHGKPPSSNPIPQATSTPPSNEEMARQERWLAIQERKAALNAPQGHRFGKLKVSKKGRAVRGNVYSGRIIRARMISRRHTFGDAHVEDKGGLIEGELQIDDIGDFFSGASETVYEGGDSDDEGDDMRM